MIVRLHRPAGLAAAGIALAVTLAFSASTAHTRAVPTCFGKPATIVGGPGNSNLKGTNGPDVIVAGNGENDVDGKDGNDRICGGKDGDDIFGNKGNDKMASGGGIDFVAGNQGNDLHNAGGGDDQVDAVQDALDSDKDRVRGLKGSDFLDVEDGEGNDSVNGGAGNLDECHFDVGDSDAACEI